MCKPAELFDLGQTQHAALFDGCDYAWDALKRLREYVASSVKPGLHNRCEGVAYIGEQVFIGEGTVVEDGAMIKGPAIIGRNCQIRHSAYIRDSVVIGDHCVVGNACEIRHTVLFNGALVPHLNYVGDSILGHGAHLGAGTIVSNYRLMPGTVKVKLEGKTVDTGLQKFGALVGDGGKSAATPCSTRAASWAAKRSFTRTSTGGARCRQTGLQRTKQRSKSLRNGWQRISAGGTEGIL
jgi:UDP-N-acetylglucosamine diphosphorylase / glucose-1-phosphate thymidylyltransferase / UDP-N-acetylgalactosamine diphosphorylase / glucosamine-1-phosphate N-acetyltransferase / galactosamine-1-phosphate N-acetyltransferase